MKIANSVVLTMRVYYTNCVTSNFPAITIKYNVHAELYYNTKHQ